MESSKNACKDPLPDLLMMFLTYSMPFCACGIIMTFKPYSFSLRIPISTSCAAKASPIVPEDRLTIAMFFYHSFLSFLRTLFTHVEFVSSARRYKSRD